MTMSLPTAVTIWVKGVLESVVVVYGMRGDLLTVHDYMQVPRQNGADKGFTRVVGVIYTKVQAAKHSASVRSR